MEVEGPRRQSSSASLLPDFEFCMVSNPSCPPSGLLTADELFFDGVIIPLHLLSLQRSEPPAHDIQDPPAKLVPDRPPSDPPPSSILLSSASANSFPAAPTSGSRRWKGLFKVAGEKKPEERDKERKKERKSSGASAELNINLNIWPFSRSHSAGNTSAAGSRPRSVASRKVSSAPCSRSNSRGESAGGGRKWAPSPGRGVYLGRSSPIWQLRRAGIGSKEKARKSSSAPTAPATGSSGGGVRLNLKVNSCIGYRDQTSCREDDSDGVTDGDHNIEGSGSNWSIFSLRALFSKKVY